MVQSITHLFQCQKSTFSSLNVLLIAKMHFHRYWDDQGYASAYLKYLIDFG